MKKNLKLLFELAEVAHLTPQEMDLYERSLKAKTDIENQVKYGKEEGKQEERLKIAKNLKYIGASPEMISQSTGLTVEQIGQL